MPANPKFCNIVLLFAVAAQADTLVLRTGNIINGTLVGASARQIDFLASAGKTHRIALIDIDRISYGKPAAAAAASSSPDKPAAPKPPVMVQAGTAVRVRIVNPEPKFRQNPAMADRL